MKAKNLLASWTLLLLISSSAAQNRPPAAAPGNPPPVTLLPERARKDTVPTQACPYEFKLYLTPSMVTNESGLGKAYQLVDEQTVAGNLFNNPGNPWTAWLPTWDESAYPLSAYVDLGEGYIVTKIFLRDHHEQSGYFTVSSGSPEEWTPLFTDSLTAYNAWLPFQVSANTRYLRFTMQSLGALVSEVVLYGCPNGDTPPPAGITGPYAQRPRKTTVDRFVGVNTWIDVPDSIHDAAGIIREYHPWRWDEGDGVPYPGYPNNEIKFQPSYAGGGAFRPDDYYQAMHDRGIEVSVCLQENPGSWLVPSGNRQAYPIDAPGLPSTSPYSYEARAHYIYQYVARYGSHAVDTATLTLASDQQKRTGLGWVRYYEDWNEQDKTWGGTDSEFQPAQYAAMLSADFDGHGRTLPGWETKSLKVADPNAHMVMGGLYNFDNCVNYLEGMRYWCQYYRPDGKLPMDVINVHHYLTSTNAPKAGESPEQNNWYPRLKALTNWRDTYAPEKEVWISEFGYGFQEGNLGYATPYGPYSSDEVEIMWNIRTMAYALKAGVDRMMLYSIRSINADAWSNNPGVLWPFTMGLTYYCASGAGCNPTAFHNAGHQPYEKRPIWYALKTFKDQLAGMEYIGDDTKGNVRIFKFKQVRGPQGAYLAFIDTHYNQNIPNYKLKVGPANQATRIDFDLSDDGYASNLSIHNGFIATTLSEMPCIILVDKMLPR